MSTGLDPSARWHQEEARRPSTNAAWQHPILAGVGVGCTLALVARLIASDADFKEASDAGLMVLAGVAIFFAGISVATLYAARFAASTPEGRTLLRRVWPLGTAFFSLFIVVGAATDWHDARRYAREGREATGTVLRSQPQEHNTLVLRYRVGGALYERTTGAPGNAASYRAGDSVQVYYYAAAPGEGFCRRPQWQPATTLEGWFIAAGIMPVWLVAAGAGLAAMRHVGRSDPVPRPRGTGQSLTLTCGEDVASPERKPAAPN